MLSDNHFKIHHVNGDTEKERLKRPAELRGVLEDHFHLALPEVPELARILKTMTASEVPVEC